MLEPLLVFIFWLSLFLIVYAYLIYPALMLIMVRNGRPSTISQKELPKVSMLIAAYNEEKVIDRKIANIRQLNYPFDKIEFLIGSDGSTDRTGEIVASALKSNSNIRFFDLPRRGKSSTLNSLMKYAKGDIFVFSDANTEYDPAAIMGMIRHFCDPRVGCVCGRLILKTKDSEIGESFYWKYETMIKKMESRVGAVVGANGAIYAIRRELANIIPEGIINDDFYLSMKIVENGYKMIYEEAAKAWETATGSFQQEFKRHVRDATGHYQVVFKLPGLLNPFIGWPFFCYVSHRLVRWIVPACLLLLLLSNMGLLHYNDVVYQLTATMQAVYYALVLAGSVLYWNGKTIRALYIPFYFSAINLALLIGFVRWLSGQYEAKWQSSER